MAIKSCTYHEQSTFDSRGRCNECRKEQAKKYYCANKEKVLKKQKEYKKNHSEKIKLNDKKQHLKYRYNLSIDEYLFLCEEQEHQCLICKRETTLVVDHCHIKGKIRGLLCTGCNMALGGFRDSIENLKSAINYLEKYKNDTN